MRITNVKTFLVEGIKYNWTLLKIETDAGLHGWGEATNWPGSPLVEAACQHVGDFITGLDARRIDYIWTKIYRDMNWSGQAGLLLSAISGVDIALWDIKGKRWAFQSMRCSGAPIETRFNCRRITGSSTAAIRRKITPGRRARPSPWALPASSSILSRTSITGTATISPATAP
jgi:Mandelate racemase / muconate lactonizing enzyme, N-terminal domain